MHDVHFFGREVSADQPRDRQGRGDRLGDAFEDGTTVRHND